MPTGWRRRIGCLKLQVIFRKRATIYGAFLRKMTYGDEASYDSTSTCTVLGLFPTENRAHFEVKPPSLHSCLKRITLMCIYVLTCNTHTHTYIDM